MPQPAFDQPAPPAPPAASAADPANNGAAPRRDIWAAVFEPAAADRPDLPIKFRFHWDGWRVACQVDDSGGALVLRAAVDLGALPYSAEQPDRRARLRALCDPAFKLPHGGFNNSAEQHVVYSAQTELHAPTTGSDVVAAITRLLLTGKPYLALLEAAPRRSRPASSKKTRRRART